MSHSTPKNEDLEFVDVAQELERTYYSPDGQYTIKEPVALCVKESGSHRVLAYDHELGAYRSHYIPGDGRRPISWIVEPNARFFIGWGETAVENTGLEKQPEFSAGEVLL